jgi:hypothetical protein
MDDMVFRVQNSRVLLDYDSNAANDGANSNLTASAVN